MSLVISYLFVLLGCLSVAYCSEEGVGHFSPSGEGYFLLRCEKRNGGVDVRLHEGLPKVGFDANAAMQGWLKVCNNNKHSQDVARKVNLLRNARAHC